MEKQSQAKWRINNHSPPRGFPHSIKKITVALERQMQLQQQGRQPNSDDDANGRPNPLKAASGFDGRERWGFAVHGRLG
jgi:hypothetical protein